jgi:hypothetical protein
LQRPPHHLDLEVALGHQLLELGVLLLEMTQPLHVDRLELAEALAPQIDRLIRDPVLLGHFDHRRGVGLTQDPDHLLFRKSGLLHDSLAVRGAIFSKFQLVLKSPGRSLSEPICSVVRMCLITSDACPCRKK